MIEVSGLSKSYGRKKALKGISFKVNRGEIFGFLGPNGAGKTTTIRVLTGQLAASGGEARIAGLDTASRQKELKPLMGVVPEETNLYERLTVYQNLAFFSRLYQAELAGVDEYLKLVELEGEKGSQVKSLSKGMKQRVLLIRALLHRPDVLFLDEPTSGLDPNSAAQIHRLLKDLNQQGMTIFLTSHNMEEVDRLCNRVAFLNQGEIAAIGSPEELKLKYTNRKMKVLIKEGEGLEERIMEMEGAETAGEFARLIEEGRLAAVHSLEPSLADIFVRVTGSDLI